MIEKKIVDGKTFYPFVLANRRSWEKDWRDELRSNDILITQSGDLRVIRSALYYADGTLQSVKLAIRRCSWTRHATTSYDRSALKSLGFRKAAVKFKPKEYDLEFQKFIESGGDVKPRWMGAHDYTCVHAQFFA